MASTTFVDGETLIEASWLNDVNAAVYTPGTIDAANVSNTPAGNLGATTVQAALNELDAEKQPLDADLTAIAALTTQAYGRSLLETANEAALKALINLEIGTDVLAYVAPGTSGNVLTSNGSAWTSSANTTLTSGTAQATTSGTAKDFTSLPTGIKHIVVTLSQVSTDGTSGLLFQIGDSGGLGTSVYEGGSQLVQEATGYSGLYSTAGIPLVNSSAGNSVSGVLHGYLVDSATNTWSFEGVFRLAGNQTAYCAGTKSLSATLDRIRLTTVNNATGAGTEAFDGSGKVNILYE